MHFSISLLSESGGSQLAMIPPFRELLLMCGVCSGHTLVQTVGTVGQATVHTGAQHQGASAPGCQDYWDRELECDLLEGERRSFKLWFVAIYHGTGYKCIKHSHVIEIKASLIIAKLPNAAKEKSEWENGTHYGAYLGVHPGRAHVAGACSFQKAPYNNCNLDM